MLTIIYGNLEYTFENIKRKENSHNGKGRINSSKVRTLASVDVEIIKNTKELVDSIVSENRLNQGVQVLTEQGIEITNKATKDFIDWVRKDVLKEEKDTILASGLGFSKVLAAVSSKAGQWFNQR
jgi:hypothetical protein